MHRERYSPQDTARHVTGRLAAALADARCESIWGPMHAFGRIPGGPSRTAWRIGHHAGRLFALRERAREEYEARLTPAAETPPTFAASSSSRR